MRLIKRKDYEEVCEHAAMMLAAQVLLKPDAVLGLATGDSPIGVYQRLIAWHRQGRLDFSKVKTVNLDEYAGLDAENPQSYRYFMQKHLFSHINIAQENTYVPDGMADDFAAECRAYDANIKRLGGIDMQLLGIGRNGHIGFNEPAGCFTLQTHLAELAQSTIQANARFFPSQEAVPRRALTMGIGGIMGAARVLLIASGKEKAALIEQIAEGEAAPQIPASVLKLHADCTVIYCE